MLGGLYKKTTYLNEFRKTNKNLVVVDSGDLLNEHDKIKDSFIKSAHLKSDLIAKIYKNLGIDAINVGELELALGLDYLKDLEKELDLPFVSSNIVNSNKELVFKPYIIKKLEGVTVGITGIMGTTSDVSKKMKAICGDTLSVEDPVKTLEKIVPELKKKADILVVMTHQAMNRNWVIARKIDGVDLVVGGHHKQRLDTPYNPNNTYIVQSGEKGQYQGMIEFSISADGTKTATNTMVKVGDEIANDAKVKAMLDEYNNEVTKLYSAGTKSSAEDVALMSASCRDCHDEAFEIWEKTDHAKAFRTLIDTGKGDQFKPDCLGCHTTRFEEPGGFTMDEQQKELRNIQCDSCHGNSASHLEDPGNSHDVTPDMETCMKCHSGHRGGDKFKKNYQQFLDKIKH